MLKDAAGLRKTGAGTPLQSPDWVTNRPESHTNDCASEPALYLPFLAKQAPRQLKRIDLAKAFLWLRYYTKSSRLRTKVIALETDRPGHSDRYFSLYSTLQFPKHYNRIFRFGSEHPHEAGKALTISFFFFLFSLFCAVQKI